MKIDKLKNLEANLTIGVETCKGMTLEEITEAESKLRIHFPKTYREFMFLAGKDTGALVMFGEGSFSYISDEQALKSLNHQLQDYKVLLNRPIWVFTEYDGYQQFLFFYLDEIDEDPEVWQALLTDRTIIKKLNTKLSEHINGVVDQSIAISNGQLDYE